MAKSTPSDSKLLNFVLTVIVILLAALLLLSYTQKNPGEKVAEKKVENKINFADTYKMVYDGQSRKRGWETYIDLVNGFAINYPQLYRVTSYCPEPRPGCIGLQFAYHPDKNVMYDDTLSLTLARVSGSSKNTDLREIAKSQSTYSIQNQDVATFEEKTINGNDVVIADFVMTQKLYDSEKVFNTYRNRQTAMEPVGFHRKTAFIKDGDRIFVLQSGSLFEPYQEEVFNTMLQSLKFGIL